MTKIRTKSGGGLDTAALNAAYVGYAQLARDPLLIITGTITRDENRAALSAPVTWPDGTPGAYAADVLSTDFPGAVDAYHVTYGDPATRTYTQPAVTRNTSGDITDYPAITIA